MSTDLANGRPTVKEMLDEMRVDLKKVVAFMQIMEAAQLPERVARVERWQHKAIGVALAVSVIIPVIVTLILGGRL